MGCFTSSHSAAAPPAALSGHGASEYLAGAADAPFSGR
jgi:hypothetical protein